MGASSTTGVSGAGDSNKATVKHLSRWALGPQIILAGIAGCHVESIEGQFIGTVVFPEPLPGSGEEHVVVLTTLNGGTAYVLDMDTENDHFTGFITIADNDCDVMYIVTKVGIRPD